MKVIGNFEFLGIEEIQGKKDPSKTFYNIVLLQDMDSIKVFANFEDVIKFEDKDGFKEIKSWAHTGSPTLDYNLRTFGLPTGIIEIAGRSRSGKTTLGLVAMGLCLIGRHFAQQATPDP